MEKVVGFLLVFCLSGWFVVVAVVFLVIIILISLLAFLFH